MTYAGSYDDLSGTTGFFVPADNTYYSVASGTTLSALTTAFSFGSHSNDFLHVAGTISSSNSAAIGNAGADNWVQIDKGGVVRSDLNTALIVIRRS